MATNNLKVEELRAQLAQRGLSTAGIKPTLTRRLEAALKEEEESDKSSAASRKRRRVTDSDSQVDVDVDVDLRSLNVKQLREEAANRGISTAGTKNELIERLSVDDNNNNNISSNDINGQATEETKVDNADSDAPCKINFIDELQAMNIKQLREEASVRGISATGTKKELLDRLCADNNTIQDDTTQGVKVENKDKNVDTQATPASKTLEELQTMSVKQLRDQAVIQGISATGTKKELLERLCSDNDGISDGNDEVKVESKEDKIVTATKKGSAVLDQWLPDHIKAQYHVLQVGEEIYDAMLNQTNVGENNNKFYLIQVLESDDGGKFMFYNRWGRVGVKGQNKLNGHNSQQSAISEFEKKFHDKTGNCWSNRKEFVSYSRSYTWIEMDYGEAKEEPSVKGKTGSTISEPRDSKLEAPIAKFVSLICNVSMMKQQMMEIGYNAEKLPLGKLSKSTILKGYEVLKRISDVIGQADRKTLQQLSGEFYTVIPHDFGFKNTSLFTIDTPQKLKSKIEMVEALGEIELATKLLKNDFDMEIASWGVVSHAEIENPFKGKREKLNDPLYSHYRQLHCELMPLDVASDEFSMIEKYTKNTHAKTHSSYDVDIVQILKVSREGEAERFQKFSGIKNRMLLWHGSRLTNWTGILSQGLRIAPPEAPVTGYMFGKGVYFADMFSKSANYCYSSQSATSGVLLLCEVALGDMAELLTSKYDADKLPAGKLSTKGVGGTAPDLSEAQTLEDGVVVPLGRPKEQYSKGSLLYNEYIVYNVEQIRMRYLVQVDFNFKR